MKSILLGGKVRGIPEIIFIFVKARKIFFKDSQNVIPAKLISIQLQRDCSTVNQMFSFQHSGVFVLLHSFYKTRTYNISWCYLFCCVSRISDTNSSAKHSFCSIF